MGCCYAKTQQVDFNETIYKDPEYEPVIDLARKNNLFLNSVNSSVNNLYIYQNNESSKIKNESLSAIINEENIIDNEVDDNLKIVIKNINDNIDKIKQSINKIELKQNKIDKRKDIRNIIRDYSKSEITINESERKFAIKNLNLIIISSKIQKVNTIITINKSGMNMNESLRNSKDGNYYFGVSPSINDNNISNISAQYINDFNFLPEKGINTNHFLINYKLGNYYLKSLKGSWTFLSLNKMKVLNDKSIIVFGNNFILVGISESINKSNFDINLKIINGADKGNE